MRTLEINREMEWKKLEIEREIKEKEMAMREKEIVKEMEMKRLELEREKEKNVKGKKRRRKEKERNIKVVPKFNEKEVSKFFAAFEKVAASLDWPKENWTIMIQSVLTGKAQIAYFTLSLDDSSDYDAVKKVVLMAYQLVPEAYRQKFWNLKKTLEHTFTKFANIKERLFQEWCASRKVKTKEQLEQLILLEDFKDCLSGDLKTYLEEQQIETLNAAATMAEEYILTHRPSTRYVTKSYTKYYAKHKPEDKTVPHSAATSTPGSPRRISPRTTVVCWTCGKRGHMAAKCCGSAGNDPRREVMLVSSIAPPVAGLEKRKELFAPYTSQGYVSSDHSGKPVVVLRDSGAAQSLILEKSLPEGVSVDGKQNVILGGFPSTLYVALLIKVYLESQYFSGECKLAVVDSLPIEGIEVILANHLALGLLPNHPLVMGDPLNEDVSPVVAEQTRSQAQSQVPSDLNALFDSPSTPQVTRSPSPDLPAPMPVPEYWTRESLIEEQRKDPQVQVLADTIVSYERS
ncbi:uncharacterized protein [Procambarus clarkii]|uniref:uncharacterized protein n=1 Tax=Procambarus clarkii TaxID=6728 RepID=UPI00374499E5